MTKVMLGILACPSEDRGGYEPFWYMTKHSERLCVSINSPFLESVEGA